MARISLQARKIHNSGKYPSDAVTFDQFGFFSDNSRQASPDIIRQEAVDSSTAASTI
jgi:hypothetical protein